MLAKYLGLIALCYGTVSCTETTVERRSDNTLSYNELSEYAFDTFRLSNGMDVNVKVDGDNNKQTILLVHGGGDSLNAWNQWSDVLKEFYKIVRMDLPGHGLTDPHPNGIYTSTSFAEFIHQFVQEYGLKDFVLVGHSYGGEASLHYMSKYPNSVNALGLISSGAYEPKWSDIKAYVKGLNAIRSDGKMAARQGLELMYHDKSRLTEDIVNRHYDLGRYEKNIGVFQAMEKASMKQYQNVSGVEKISVPTMLMWGDKDIVSSLDSIGRRLNREIPKSKLVVYQNVGHLPNYVVARESAIDFMRFVESNLIK